MQHRSLMWLDLISGS